MHTEQYFQPEIETASRDALHAIQSARLAEMAASCYANVPFYRAKFDEIGLQPGDIRSIGDIAKLPFTTKQDLRDTYPYGLFAVPKERLVRIHASSGTTGKQTVVGYTQRDVQRWSEGAARALAAAGCTRGDYVHVSYGYGLFTGGLGLHYGAELLGATVIPVSSGNTARQVQILQDFGSNYLCCTPSYAMFIGETMAEMGIDPKILPLRGGLFGAEPWTPAMRAEIERLLDIEAHVIYGLSEIAGPGVSYDCEAFDGLHICEDYFYPEIIDPDTLEPMPDGEYGELVFTCIGKEALPLVRYRTRDISALTRAECACGRTLVRMLKPKGRSDDMLIIRGVNVFPSQVEHVILEQGFEPNYQIHVERTGNLDVMTVLVELSEAVFSDSMSAISAAEQRLKNAMLSTLGVSASIKLVEPRSIPRSEGKAVRVIDKRKI
ncbi:MAG: phenylacetate--CoA ligase [Oscillospiraceae bacterium]|nr:phenylacetate--CoA ligase [Oscillospiraceae bacterium]